MKKVLIVEDEILARLGLRQLVDWRKLELELLPDATVVRISFFSI